MVLLVHTLKILQQMNIPSLLVEELATVVEGNNEATTASKLGKTKPIDVHENNYGNTKLANTGLKSNNTLSAHIVEENEGWFYE